MKININLLKEHPLNQTIYGQDDNEEQFQLLVNRIRESGWIDPVIVNNENEFTLLSGHRRYRAAKLLGFTSLDYQIVNVSPEEELEILLNSNVYREKTISQKTRESEYYYEIESRKARERQLSGTTLSPSRDQGRTDEIVANKVGMSRSSLRRAQQVLKNTEKIADPALKWLLEETLNEDITAAQNLSEKPVEFIQQVHDLVEGDVKQVGKVINELENLEYRNEIPLPPGKYQVIYMEQGNQNIDQYNKLPMGGLGESDSVLFLWTNPSLLENSMKIIHQMGFHYKTAFLWNKDVLNEVSDSGEIMMVATKGNPPMIKQTTEIGIMEKPQIVRQMIDQTYPHQSKIQITLGEGWKKW